VSFNNAELKIPYFLFIYVIYVIFFCILSCICNVISYCNVLRCSLHIASRCGLSSVCLSSMLSGSFINVSQLCHIIVHLPIKLVVFIFVSCLFYWCVGNMYNENFIYGN